MSSRHMNAVVVGFALVAAPIAAPVVWAQAPALDVQIRDAARAAAGAPGFSALSNTEKSAAIQKAIAVVLSKPGSTPAQKKAALLAAVKAGYIDAASALAVAILVGNAIGDAAFAQGLATELAAAGYGAQLAAAGLVTASTSGAGGVTVLNGLGGGGVATTSASYDPCAGVIASYCGT